MKVFVLAVLVAAVSAGPLGSCRWEKEHWCDSLRSAKECGAVQYCISRDWSLPREKQSGNDICQYCENIIGDVRNFLTNNQTEAQIQQFLDQACSVIPISELADQCMDYVDNDLPELFAMVRAKLDPQTICTLIGLCSGPKAWSAQAAADTFVSATLVQGAPQGALQAPSKVGGNICTDCKALVTDLKQMLTDKTTEDEVEALLKQTVCASLGSIEAECNTLVDTYTPELLALLSQEIDPDTFCAFFCNQTKGSRLLLTKMRLEKSALYKAAQKLGSAEECLICKTVLSELQSLDRDKTVQADVENFFKEKVCTQLGSLNEACQQTVDEYAPILFELLVNELDPETRCRSLGFCTQSNSVESLIRLSSLSQKRKPSPVKTSAQCVLCEFIMRELDEMLATNRSEAAIVEALDKVCSVLPDTIKEECKTFVDTYAPAIIELLAQELDPQQVCTTLGLCKSTSTQSKPLTFVAQLPVKASSDELCGICETVIQYMDSLLEENCTVQEIEALVEKICSFLPKNLEAQCDNFIMQYGPAIIELLAQFADPKEICTELKLCTAKKPVLENVIQRAPSPQLLGAKECTWGPSYWCASRDNAKRCNAIPHCEKHVWKN